MLRRTLVVLLLTASPCLAQQVPVTVTPSLLHK